MHTHVLEIANMTDLQKGERCLRVLSLSFIIGTTAVHWEHYILVFIFIQEEHFLFFLTGISNQLLLS